MEQLLPQSIGEAGAQLLPLDVDLCLDQTTQQNQPAQQGEMSPSRFPDECFQELDLSPACQWLAACCVQTIQRLTRHAGP